MSADFSRVAAHLADGLRQHALRDWPGDTGPDRIRRTVFIDRGGHAPGETCPTETSADPHYYMCQYPDDECTCHLYGGTP